MIISPAFISSFFHMCALLFCDPPIGFQRVALFLCPKYFLAHVSNVWGSLTSYPWDQQYFLWLYLFSFGSVCHCGLGFSSRAYGCTPPFLGTPPLIVRADAATLRLHNSAWIDRIWSPWQLNHVVRFAFVIVSLVNDASHTAIKKRKNHKSVFRFAIFHVVGVAATHRSFCLLEFPPVYVCLLEMCLETHICAFICCNTLPHAVCMCVFPGWWEKYLRRKNTWVFKNRQGALNAPTLKTCTHHKYWKSKITFSI